MADAEKEGPVRRLTDEELLAAVPRGIGGREARLGLFAIVSLLSFLIILYWMTDPSTFRGRYILVTTVQNAGGVRVADPIQMNGVNVGKVDGFRMRPDGLVDIRLEIENEWQVPTGSHTLLGEAGLFGGRTIQIVPSGGETMYAEFDTLPSEGMASADLFATAGDLGERAGNVLSSIDRMLDAETVGAVQGSMRELEKVLTDFATLVREQRTAVGTLTASLNRSASGIEDAAAAGPDAARAIARADSAITVLTATGTSLDRALISLHSILDRMDRGEGTLGRLAQDPGLYENLNAAALSVRTLMEDLQANPKKYINVSIF